MSEPVESEYREPEGTLRVSQLASLQSITADDVRRRMNTPVARLVADTRSKFLEGLQKDVFAPLAEVFRGLRPAGFERVADAFQDGQQALKNAVELLSPLLDYGSAYMDAQGGFLKFGQNYGEMPFTNQLGPARNCELHDNGIRLLKRGLWDIRCQMAYGGTALGVGSGAIEWYIRVYTPEGTVFSQQKGVEWNQKASTSTIVSSVVVPGEGYVVKVEVAWIHGSREIWGGPANNRLVVQHISNTIGVGGTGAEGSYDPGRDEGEEV